MATVLDRYVIMTDMSRKGTETQPTCYLNACTFFLVSDERVLGHRTLRGYGLQTDWSVYERPPGYRRLSGSLVTSITADADWQSANPLSWPLRPFASNQTACASLSVHP